MEKANKSWSQFLLRMSHGEAVQLDAIAHHLGITKSQVLRLSLSANNGMKPSKAEAGNAASSEILDAVYARINALDARLKSIESTLAGAVDLLLSISQNAQPSQPAQASAAEEKPASKVGKVPPTWSAYLVKYIRPNNFRTEEEWVEYLRGHYIKNIGFPPDMRT